MASAVIVLNCNQLHTLLLTFINSGCHAYYKLFTYIRMHAVQDGCVSIAIVLCSKYGCAVFYSGMLLGLGGNPYGPAGTGKTESVKALGNLFGRQVLVFNCDEVRHWLMRFCCVSCRAEMPSSEIVQSPVVFSYICNFTVRCI